MVMFDRRPEMVLKFDRSQEAISRQSGCKRELTGYCKCAIWRQRSHHFRHTANALLTALHCRLFTLWS